MPDAPGPDTGPAVSRVVFDAIAYDAVAGPDEASALVQSIRASALQQLEIDTLARHLRRVDELLLIGACGLAGMLHPSTRQALGAQVMGLQYRLRSDTGAVASALSSYGDGARTLIGVLKAALKDLYGHHEADALTRLARCDAQVMKMAESTAELEGKLQGLGVDIARVVGLATEAIAAEGRSSPGLEARRAEIDTRLARLRSLRAAARAAHTEPDLTVCDRTALAAATELTSALDEAGPVGHTTDGSRGPAIVLDSAIDQADALASGRALGEQQREALQAMSRDALQLAAARDKGEIEEAAVVALLHAVLEVEQIVALVADQGRSLTRMASDCARLTRVELRAEIERLMPATAAQGVAVYGQRGFLARALWVAAQWHGLKQAAEACHATLHGVYVKMGETYTRNPTIEEARQLAPQLGSALALELAAEMRERGA